MTHISKLEYIKEASLLLNNRKIRDLKIFFITYCINICSKKYILPNWNSYKIGDDIKIIKEEATRLINKELLNAWDVEDSDYEFIIWHKKYTLNYFDSDVLGEIYLICSQDIHRKKMGEHYTREDIIHYIINILPEKELKNKKIIDPCCGSGNFLIEILKYNFNACKTQQEKQQIIEKMFIQKFLVGIDIQEIPCLISKIRMILTTIEYTGILNPDLNMPVYQKDSLKENCNLLSSDYDLVITNPPYLRYQLISEDYRNYLKENYICTKGRFDLYVVFIERCIKLAKDRGRIIIVTSDKFMNAEYGKEVRQFITDNYFLEKVQDLRKIFAFKASVLSAIYYIKKTNINNQNVIWEQIQENNDGFLSVQKGKIILENTWRYIHNDVSKIINKLISNRKAIKLATICNISVGIQTTADTVFCENYKTPKFKEAKLEKELIYPLLNGKTVRKWRVWKPNDNLNAKDRILYPYIKNNNTTELIELDKFPKTKIYLHKHKKLLTSRSYMGNKKWYEHLSPKSHFKLEKIKIVTPDLSSKCNFALDTDGYFCNGTVYFIQFRENQSIEDYIYLLGILNSKVIEFIHKNVNTVHLTSKKYRFQTNTMKNYPIIYMDNKSKEHIEINELVKEILSKSEQCVSDLEKRLNKCIYNIYGLDDKEISIIESFL